MGSDALSCPVCGREMEIGNGECACGHDEIVDSELAELKPHYAITARLDVLGKEFKAATGEIWGLDVDDVQSFILQAERKFKLKRKNHGFILKNQLNNSTASVLKKYIDNSGKIDFKSFVNSFMQNIKVEASLARGKVSGGSIVFIHYHIDNANDGLGRLFIIMVDNNSVFNFDENLVPKKLPSIDMDSLRQGVLVDLTLFNTAYPENKSDPYLQFITGRSSSNFFKKAIGCEEDLDNNRSIDEANRAVNDFINFAKLGAVDKFKVLKAVEELMHDKFVSKTDNKVTVLDIERKIDEVVGKNKVAKGKFSHFVAVHDYIIDGFFEPSRTSEDKFGQIKLTDEEKDYSCSISIDAISNDESSGKKAIYKNGSIIIKLSESDNQKMRDIFKKG